MSALTRRQFLQTTALAISGLAASPLLSACGSPAGSPVAPTPRTARPAVSPSPVSASAPANPYPHLAVARHGEPDALVRRALSALGGMQRFVPAGASVVIKPNICVAYHTYEYAATTNPWVVAALVRLSLEAGASSVRVMDFPFGGSPEEAYQRSGIAPEVIAAGGEMVAMPRLRFVPASLPQAVDLHEARIFQDILDADVLINVPVAKHHSLARLTLGMKNLMGTILDRSALHRNLGQRIADLSGFLRPTLTVIDAVRILTANGPTGGSLDDVQQLDTVIASPDIVAADSYAAGLFGLQPSDLAYVQAGAAAGLGSSDLENLKIEEIEVGG